MIIFWIFTLFVGASAFAFALIGLQVGIGLSFVYAIVAMLLARGILSIVRRRLIVAERIAPEPDILQRTVETNRAVFWKRAIVVALVPIAYLTVAYTFFGLAPEDALVALPDFLALALTQLIYLLFLLGANFMLFFGPFYLYTRIGKTMTSGGRSQPSRRWTASFG